MPTERQRDGLPGWFMAAITVLLAIVAAVGVAWGIGGGGWFSWLLAIAGGVGTVALLPGFFVVERKQAQVLELFGRYVGTARASGLRWDNPLLRKKSVSLRVRHLETPTLKVGDEHGQPIELGAMIVWRVVDPGQAIFETDQYEKYVAFQSEAALRDLARRIPRELPGEEDPTLGVEAAELGERLRAELRQRLGESGIDVAEARIAHLAYAPEVASAMRQAGAFLAARQRIVDGAVGLVERALSQLDERGVVQLDEKDKAALASKLLVALCSEQR